MDEHYAAVRPPLLHQAPEDLAPMVVEVGEGLV
ncbi:MAG: hypothetical protein ACI9K2_004020 [Myxococcota bacterium]|jgi:hypothetical protein